MASFLSGLMGSLKGIGSDLGGGVSKLGRGLMGAIDPALAGTPGGAARAPGSGGLLSATDAAMSDLGDFKFGPGLTVQGQTPATAPGVPKAPGFFKRINTADAETGLSTVDKWDRFGGRLQDISDGGSRAATVDAQAKGRIGLAEKKALAAQIDALYPDDPQMAFLLKANPEAATKALSDVYKSHHEAANVGAGDTRVFGDPTRGGTTFMAPKYGVEDGYSYEIGPDGFDWGDQRGQTHGEVETGRHNREGEVVSRGQLEVSRRNAGTSAGHLGLARDRLDFDRSKEGYSAGLPRGLPPLPPGFRPVRQ